MCFIKYVCRVPLRMTDEMCEIGDYAIHGEEPYTFEYYNRNYRRIAGYEHQGITDTEKAIREARKSHEIQIHNKNAFGIGNGVDNIVISGQDPNAGSSGDEVTPTKESTKESKQE